ncbi:hypothetical protein EVAR_61268_1 [Eumeta japonica]|uniref:Reverse transcriptase domain-containing protein n=1 Tax=Eumeta variegata TaxID=151549 RepID=A0A4C1Z5G6_EUMVA|nr:hypothetical protein EVAR_61268_1 [Eumeta japonica]
MDKLPVKCLLYADEQVILAPSARELREIVTKMDESIMKRFMKVNVSNTKAMVFERGESITECGIYIEALSRGDRSCELPNIGDHRYSWTLATLEESPKIEPFPNAARGSFRPLPFKHFPFYYSVHAPNENSNTSPKSVCLHNDLIQRIDSSRSDLSLFIRTIEASGGGSTRVQRPGGIQTTAGRTPARAAAVDTPPRYFLLAYSVVVGRQPLTIKASTPCGVGIAGKVSVYPN